MPCTTCCRAWPVRWLSPEPRPGSVYVGLLPTLAGTVTLTDCTLDLSASNSVSGVWQRAGLYSLALSGGTVKPALDTTRGLIDAFTAAVDSVALAAVNVIGPAGLPLIYNYNATGIPRTYYG